MHYTSPNIRSNLISFFTYRVAQVIMIESENSVVTCLILRNITRDRFTDFLSAYFEIISNYTGCSIREEPTRVLSIF